MLAVYASAHHHVSRLNFFIQNMEIMMRGQRNEVKTVRKQTNR